MPKKNILIIAPHPDDETLGCGGTIFKHKKKGDNVFLVIITSVKTITDSNGNINKFYKNSITQNRENQKIKKFYNFKKIFYRSLKNYMSSLCGQECALKLAHNFLS